jgi:hypothetical protein
MSKLTPWFRPEIKPVRKGWYERKWASELSRDNFDYWNGKRWYSAINGVRSEIPTMYVLAWRGLAVNPQEGAAE